MALPITIPNTFAGATSAIPLSQLDNNFTTVVNGVNGIGNGTNSLANVSITGGSIANVTLTGTVTAPTNGYRRNRIINGAMQIDQRNNGAAQTITTAGSYTVDRWTVVPTGASVTGQRVSGPTGYQYAYQITGAASVTQIVFTHKIESANVFDLVNQNVIFSVTLANSLLTTVNWQAYYPTAVDNFTTNTSIASGTFTVTSTATQYTATFNAGANVGNGLLIILSVGAQTSGTWTITGAQLEAGSSTTPFERLSIGETLALCQRYYYAAGGFAVNAVQFVTAPFPVTLRSNPTFTIVNCTGVQSSVTVSKTSWYFQNTQTSGFDITAAAEL
jgi:hypothetical protein